ncbi:MAG: hypothetical protein WDN69_01265 [Aliidongia sp.]
MAKITRRGFIMVLSSPSGAGKTTLTHRLLQTDPDLSLSVSVTTRPRRPERGRRCRLSFHRPRALRPYGRGR